MTIAGLACLLAVEASGCGNTGGGQVTSIRIGVSVYDQYDTFVSEMINHFNEYASEVSASMDSNVSANIDVYNAAASQTTQNNQVKTMLEDGCDIICVNLVDRTEPVTIIDMAEKQDVPVIFFNRELVEQDLERWDKLYYVLHACFYPACPAVIFMFHELPVIANFYGQYHHEQGAECHEMAQFLYRVFRFLWKGVSITAIFVILLKHLYCKSFGIP